MRRNQLLPVFGGFTFAMLLLALPVSGQEQPLESSLLYTDHQHPAQEQIPAVPSIDFAMPSSVESELRAEIQALEKRLDALSGAMDQEPESNPASGALLIDLPSVAKPKETEVKFPNYKITGFTQLDGAFHSQDATNRATVGDAQDGVGFRRARLAVNGKVAPLTAYQLEVDFANGGRPSFFDIWVRQEDLPYLGNVQIGHFCQPFSADSLTGFRNLTFLERSLPFLAMVPFRRLGVQSSQLSDDEMSSVAVSVFRTGGYHNAPLGDGRFGTDIGDIGGYSLSTRVTHLLDYEPEDAGRLFHIGAGYNFSVLGANDADGSGVAGNAGSPRPFYRARTTPEFGPMGYSELSSSFGYAVNGTPIFVDTGRYEADNFHLFGLETIYQHGAFGAQAEFMATVVDSTAGAVFYHGAYAQVAYRLTGEHREYNQSNRVLGKLVPNTDFIATRHDGVQGWGAWEIAARWSYVDLTNPDKLDGHYYDAATNTFTGTHKAGNGTLHDTTLGLTWFLNTHTKMQFNWIHAMLDNTAKGRSNADLFVARVQVDF